MNEVGIYVIESALQEAQEDLARAKNKLKEGGAPFDDAQLNYFVNMYQRMVNELTEALAEARNGYTEPERRTEVVS